MLGMLQAGMDCLRINTAHDNPTSWDRLLLHLARAQEETGKHCRVLMDLAGPKLRTGPIQPGSAVIKWRPRRDVYGRVTAPARIWFTRRETPQAAPEPAAATLPVAGEWLASARIDDTIEFVDARGAKRAVTIVARRDGGVWGEAPKTPYVSPGTTLRGNHGRTEITDLPATSQAIVLTPGDSLVLLRDSVPGRPAVRGLEGEILQPATISVTLPEIFDEVRVDHTIWLDDGKIGGVIRRAERDRIDVDVTITHARAAGSKLLADKGINLPDTDLRLPALTPKDLEDLRFIAARADIVGYSFVRDETDVRELQSHLSDLGGERLGSCSKLKSAVPSPICRCCCWLRGSRKCRKRFSGWPRPPTFRCFGRRRCWRVSRRSGRCCDRSTWRAGS